MVAPTETSEHPHQEPSEGTKVPSSIARAIEELRSLGAQFAEHAKYLISLQVDRAKFTAKKAAFFVALAAIGGIALFGALVAGAGMLVIGLSGLLGMLIGNFWAGAAIVGFLVVAVPIAGAFVAMKVVTGRSMKALRLKYAETRLRQKAVFNRDIREVARG